MAPLRWGGGAPPRTRKPTQAKAHHAPHEEIAAAEVQPGLVDDTADLQPPPHQLPLLVGGGGGRLLEPLQRRLAAELEQEVPVGLRDDVRLPHRPAALGDDRADLDAAGQHRPHRSGVGELVVEHQAVAAGLHGRRRQPANDLQLRQVLVDPVEEGVGRERERVGQQQHRPVGMVGPADERRPVRSLHHLEADGRQQGRRQPGGEQRESGGVLHLAAAADHRPGGAAEEDGRVEEPPDGRGDVLEGADMVRRCEQHHQIGALVAEPLEHLADGLADRLAGDGVLGEPVGVLTHDREPTGLRHAGFAGGAYWS
jgi:hypothetical protein